MLDVSECEPVNGYTYTKTKKGCYFFTKISDRGEITIKLYEADILDEEKFEFMTLNNITRK